MTVRMQTERGMNGGRAEQMDVVGTPGQCPQKVETCHPYVATSPTQEYGKMTIAPVSSQQPPNDSTIKPAFINISLYHQPPVSVHLNP